MTTSPMKIVMAVVGAVLVLVFIPVLATFAIHQTGGVDDLTAVHPWVHLRKNGLNY